jgi:hypothetical protein
MRTRLLGVTVAALVAVGSALIMAGPAHATSTADETCVGTTSATYSPGITDTPSSTDFTLADAYDTCVGSDSTITSGYDGFSGTITTSCNVLDAVPYVDTVHWNNGSESVIYFTTLDVDTELDAQVVVLDGDVISGEYAGDTVVETSEFLISNLLGCLAPGGLTSTSGTTELEITGL